MGKEAQGSRRERERETFFYAVQLRLFFNAHSTLLYVDCLYSWAKRHRVREERESERRSFMQYSNGCFLMHTVLYYRLSLLMGQRGTGFAKRESARDVLLCSTVTVIFLIPFDAPHVIMSQRFPLPHLLPRCLYLVYSPHRDPAPTWPMSKHSRNRVKNGSTGRSRTQICLGDDLRNSRC